MSPDFAETAVAEPTSTLTGVAHTGASRPFSTPLERLRADGARIDALRDVWRALWVSRLLVWVAGAGTVATLGFGPLRHAFAPPGLMSGFGRLGDVLAAPAARWDSAWYLTIAHYGYRPDLGAFTASRTAFFPLYPLGLRAVSGLGVPAVLAGVLLSVCALAFGLYGLHRLCTLEMARLSPGRGRDVARLTVLSCALSPMAFFFSAVYSESLYLALSVGVFLCARRGRWGPAAGCAALAAATRSTGIVLVLPLALLYLYGPREDRAPEREHPVSSVFGGIRPRYRLHGDSLWILLVPTGVLLYMAHLALAGGDALSPFSAQAGWSRHFAGPYGGVWDGCKAAWQGARQLLSFGRTHVYFPLAGSSPRIAAGHNLLLFAFLLTGAIAVVGVLRLLPFAYGAYLLGALALPLSYPVASQPLMSLPRFLLVLFPLNIWLAVRLVSRPRLTRAVLVLSALGLAFFAAEFSTWHWVA
ncbi:MAG: mannosyltransferase family protein [Solirubrobacteraceae bacterium]